MDTISIKQVKKLSYRRTGLSPCKQAVSQVNRQFGSEPIRITKQNVAKFVDIRGGRAWAAWFITECLNDTQLKKVALYIDPRQERYFHTEGWWGCTPNLYVSRWRLQDHIRRWSRERISKALYQIIKSL